MSKAFDNQDEFHASKSTIILTENATHYLSEAGKWGKFLSIMGFCILGLSILIGVTATTVISMKTQDNTMPFPSALMGMLYVIIGIVYFFPMYYLYKFSMHVIHGINSKDTMTMDKAFAYLKAHYKFSGIVMIVLISFYFLAALIGLLGVLSK
jgi:hypothetical protein